jgi:hypothetical protein
MTLSVAAQAVLAAYQNTSIDDALTAAAVLRASANQLTPYSVEDMPGAAFCRNKLLVIANELEALS